MKELFHIEEKEDRKVPVVLSLRLGEKHFSFAVTNKSGDEVHQLTYCSLEYCNEEELYALKNAYPVLGFSFFKVLIAYDNPQAQLIPFRSLPAENSSLLLKIMTGDLYGSHIVSEAVDGWQISNVYAMSKEVEDWINQQFPGISSFHQYSLAIKNIHAGEDCLLVDFRHEDFTVMAGMQGQLLLAQTFLYSNYEDVIFHLLKICTEFNLSRGDVKLRLSGLVDKGSALYKELFGHFTDIGFREPTWKSTGKEFPPHFFTSLNDLAVCAS